MKNTRYISAGAGSGKTTYIVNELTSIVDQTSIRPSEIIMTTFTKAAAQEMRERARQGLLKKGKIDKAAELDAAAIGTIHSICMQFIQRYWYMLGISPEPKTLEENDFAIFADRSLFSKVTDNDVLDFEQWREKLEIMMQNPNGKKMIPAVDYWRKILRTMIERARYYHIDDLSASCDKSLLEIDNLWANLKFDINEYKKMETYFLHLNATSPNSLKKDGTLNTNAQNRIDKLRLFDPTNGEKFPLGSRLADSDLETERKRMDAYLKKRCFTDDIHATLTDLTKRLFEIAMLWLEDYQQFKKEHQLLDYNDMELYFRELLEKPEVRNDISRRYKLLFVDEYQDCNSIQIEIFNLLSELIPLTEGLDYSSMWVGDPKQAIYGFRGSDTDQTKAVSDTIRELSDKGDEHCSIYPLKDSYRSRKELVDLVNQIFLPIFGSAHFNLKKEEIELGVAREDKLPTDQRAVFCWDLKDEDPFANLAQNVRRFKEEGKYLVQLKDDKKTVRPLEYEDIAILVRRNETVADVVEALRREGIEACAPEHDILARAEVQLLLAVVQYTKEFGHRPHLRADMLHLLKGEPTKELLESYMRYIGQNNRITYDADNKRKIDNKEWRIDEPLPALVERIAEKHVGSGIYDTMLAFVDNLGLMHMVEQWGDGELRRGNIASMLQLAKDFDRHIEQMRTPDEDAPKIRFAEFAKYVVDSGVNSSNLDSKAVKVLTYHKSKGLDWPMVVLFELNADSLTDKKVHKFEYAGVREQKETGVYWLRVMPKMGRTFTDNAHETVTRQSYFKNAKKRVLCEETRLFYVGITRARDILVFVKENGQTQCMDEILKVGNVAINSGYEQGFDPERALQHIALPKTCQLIDRTAIGRALDAQVFCSKTDSKPLTYRISPSTTGIEGLTYNCETVETCKVEIRDIESQRMHTVGTCIHNVYASFNPSEGHADAVKKADNIIDSYGLKAHINAEEVICAIEQLYERLTMRFGAAISIDHELPFSLPLPTGQLLHGEIDMLWHTKDGVVLVDFKNVQKEDPKPDGYFNQMTAYMKAIQAKGMSFKEAVLFYATHGKMFCLKELKK